MGGTASEERIALVGFGEAAGAFLSGWGSAAPGECATYDVKLLDPAQAGGMIARCRMAGVEACPDPAGALARAKLVFCW